MPAKPKALVTVIEAVYHQLFDEQPIKFEIQYEHRLSTDGEPCLRARFEIGGEWQPLNLGWVEQPSYIALRNNPTRFGDKLPTEEQLKEAAGKILELDCGGGCSWFIYPGDMFRGYPSDATKLRIRCLSGTVKASLFVIPR